jgi:putative SOS response-associated peptidase YedK
MCDQYAFRPTSDFYSRFSLKNKLPRLLTVNNAAPGNFMPIIFWDKGNTVDIKRWGFVPQWAQNLDFGTRLFNAKAETVLENRAYCGSFNSCRCLIPVNSFSFLKAHRSYKLKNETAFSLAGLYSNWESPDGSFMPTFTILTTYSNDLIKSFSDRMPVVLSKKDEEIWLNPMSLSMRLFPLMRPFPSGLMI